MTERATLPARLYRRMAAVLLGRRMPAHRLDDMAAVFAVLWREASGRPLERVRLIAAEGRGLWQSRVGDPRTGGEGMREIARDFQVGMRALRRSPLATSAAALTLALGIGGTTAVVSVADGVLFHPLPFPDADRLLLVGAVDADGRPGRLSYEDFRDLQAESRTLDALAVWFGNSIAVTGLGEPERIRGEYVTASYFDVLGVQPALGRSIAPGEDVEGGAHTVVLSHAYWVRRFGSDPSILGTALALNDRSHTVVGIMPPEFRSLWDPTEAWISFHSIPGVGSRGNHFLPAFGKLAEGVDAATAERELDGIMARLSEAYPDTDAGRGAQVRDLAGWVVGEQRSTLVWSLLGAIALVLLIATANVANLQLSRASERAREMAIRSALGARRGRLVRQLLIENLTLAAFGGALGVVGGAAALRVLVAGYPPFAVFDVALDRVALAVTLAVTLGAGLLAGLVPALRASAARPEQDLRGAGRQGGPGREAGRFRAMLVVTQMALAVTLLVGAGLLVRTSAALASVEPGFDPENLLTSETRLTGETYRSDASRRVYLEQVIERLGRMSGVRGATMIAGMPFSGDGGSIPVRAEGSDLSWEQAPMARTPTIDDRYFEVMGIPVLEGRAFAPTDGPDAEFVIVVSRAVADLVYPGASALGRMIETPEGAARIVGVVGDTREALASDFAPTLYVHYRQIPPRLFSLVLRTQGAPGAYERALKEAFWEVDSNQPLWEIMPMEDRMAGYRRNEHFFSVLLAVFAAFAATLSAVGIYGVMSHAVGQRRQELGIRLALGAGRARILAMVLRRGLALTVLGAVIGLAGAAGLARVLASVLFGVGAYDPVAFTIGPALLVVVSVSAVWLPARRATRVDPVRAFRE